MKKISIFLVTCMLLSGNIMNAQSWKELKNKAKKAATSAPKNNEKTDDSGSSNSSSTSGTRSPAVINTVDEEYSAFVSEKYSLLQDYDYNLSIHTLEQGSVAPEKHYEGTKKLDYPATLKKLQEKGKKGLKDNQDYHYKILLEYGEKYQKVFDEVIVNSINAFIEEAYRAKANSPKIAVEQAGYAKKIAEAALFMNPANDKAKMLKGDAEAAVADLESELNKMFTSDFHKENAGKILFSKKPIIVGQEDPDQFTSDFTVNDNIYAIAYKEEEISGGGSQYTLHIDGMNWEHVFFTHNEEDKGKTTYPIEIIPAVDKAIHGVDAEQFARVLGKLSPRRHTIEVEFEGAKGTFSINLAGMDVGKLKANAAEATSNAQDNYARNRSLPREFSETTQKFNDPQLSQANMKKLLQKKWADSQEVLKVVVLGDGTEDDWIIIKNEVDIPTHKATDPSIAAIYKGKDGWCYFVKGIVFKRDYTGAGNYSEAKLMVDGYHHKIDCSKCQ